MNGRQLIALTAAAACVLGGVAALLASGGGDDSASQGAASTSWEELKAWHDWDTAESRITVETQDGLPELHRAAGRGDLAAVKRLLEAGEEMNAQDLDGWTPLHWAAYEGKTEVVRLLLERGASPDAEAYELGGDVGLGPPDVFPRARPETWVRVHKRVNSTPLKAALAKGREEAAAILLVSDLTQEQKDELLQWTVRYGYGGGAAILLDNGADGEIVDEDGWTLLHHAANRKSASTVKALLERGADPHARTRSKEIRMHPAGRRRTPADQTPLHLGAGDAEVVGILLAHGADVDARDSNGSAPLHLVGDRGPPAEVLLAHGADVNARDNKGETPLAKAMGFYYKGARDALMAHGANINAKDDEGKSLLHKAVGNADLSVWLLDQGAELNARDKTGRTPLHDLASDAWTMTGVENAALLLSRGADIAAEDESGDTPLRAAIQGNNREVVFFLHAEMAARGLIDETAPPLHRAARAGDTRRVAELLDAGSSVDEAGAYSETALHIAVSAGQAETVELLVSRGADVNAQDQFGWTPLHKAAWDGSLPTATILIDHGAKLELQAVDDDRPLHLAVSRGQFDVVELLLSKGADPNARGRYHSPPLCRVICMSPGVSGEAEHRMSDLLEEYGAKYY